PQLGDFGIARVVGAAPTVSGDITATILYAAPEVLEGRPPSPSSDLYSLAATIVTALSGRPPFLRDTDESMAPLMVRIVTEPASSLRCPGVPDAVWAVIERAMSKDPARRQPDLARFVRELQGAQRTLRVPATSVPGLAAEAIDPNETVAGASPLEPEQRARSRWKTFVRISCQAARWLGFWHGAPASFPSGRQQGGAGRRRADRARLHRPALRHSASARPGAAKPQERPADHSPVMLAAIAGFLLFALMGTGFMLYSRGSGQTAAEAGGVGDTVEPTAPPATNSSGPDPGRRLPPPPATTASEPDPGPLPVEPVTPAGQAGTPTTVPTTFRTARKLLQPWQGGAIRGDIAVESEEVGSCFGGSVTLNGREDAWRCSTENSQILDPCFSEFSSAAEAVACQPTPWSSVVLLYLTESLPSEFSNQGGDTDLPWALELANEEQCVLIGGATTTLAGMRLNYDCTNGEVYGENQGSDEAWRVFYQASGASDIREVDVRVLWR
ncbi:MAG: hypothetical protein H0V05_10450, partial [Euzebyaceae bacterium]|nr:hypothetical protein [Euzebyaceae bacterium]